MNPCKCKYIGKERSKCIFVTGSLKSGNPKYDFFFVCFLISFIKMFQMGAFITV